MLVRVTGGMSLVDGSLKPEGTGALGSNPVRDMGGWSKVEMAGRGICQLASDGRGRWSYGKPVPLLPDSGMDGDGLGSESRFPPMEVIGLAAEGCLTCWLRGPAFCEESCWGKGN